MRACVADSQATVWNADFFIQQSPLPGEAELRPFFLSCVCTCVMSGALHLHLPSLDVAARRVPGTRLPTCPVSLEVARRELEHAQEGVCP